MFAFPSFLNSIFTFPSSFLNFLHLLLLLSLLLTFQSYFRLLKFLLTLYPPPFAISFYYLLIKSYTFVFFFFLFFLILLLQFPCLFQDSLHLRAIFFYGQLGVFSSLNSDAIWRHSRS